MLNYCRKSHLMLVNNYYHHDAIIYRQQARRYVESINEVYTKRKLSEYFVGANPKGREI